MHSRLIKNDGRSVHQSSPYTAQVVLTYWLESSGKFLIDIDTGVQFLEGGQATYVTSGNRPTAFTACTFHLRRVAYL